MAKDINRYFTEEDTQKTVCVQMLNVVIRDKKIKNPIRYHYTYIRMPKIQM